MAAQKHENLRTGKGWRMARLLLNGVALASVVLLCGYGNSYTHRNPAALMAEKMGRPEQLLIGLGATNTADIKAQKIKVDILDHYLVGVGESSWTSWNAPRGDYIRIVTEQADSIGAVPMFTLYQMAIKDEGNLSGLTDRTFMSQYWDNVRLLFIKLGRYDSPALVNLEPEFWGHAQKQALNGDPTTLDALVSINPDCAGLPDNVSGLVACYLRSAHKYAPRTMLGFPVAEWGGRSSKDVAHFMKSLGADQVDFLVLPSEASDAVGHNSQDYLGKVNFYHKAMHDLPVLLWRSSLGVSPDIPGADSGETSNGHVRFFLSHPEKLVAAGGIGVVFSAGETDSTDITTDGGQFRILSLQYLANPAPLL